MMRSLLALAVLVTAGLAGCMAGDRVHVPDGCDLGEYESCPTDPESFWRIRPFDLRCEDPRRDYFSLASAPHNTLLENSSIEGCRYGIVFTGGCRDCTLRLRNIRATVRESGNPESRLGGVLHLREWGRVEIENVTVQVPDYAWGVDFQARTASIRGLHVESRGKVEKAGGLNQEGGITRENVEIADSTFKGFTVGFTVDANKVRIANVSLAQNGSGMLVYAGEGQILAVNATNNLFGLVVGTKIPRAREPAALDIDGVAATDNHVGIQAFSGQVALSNIEARRNGIGLNVTVAGVVVSVKDSHFEGNSEFAVRGAGQIVMAPDNWWGSPQGPRVGVEGAQVPGQGDAVSLGVQFLPFRTQP